MIKNVIAIDFEKHEVQTVTEWTKEQEYAQKRFLNYLADMIIKYGPRIIDKENGTADKLDNSTDGSINVKRR